LPMQLAVLFCCCCLVCWLLQANLFTFDKTTFVHK
jgi:hypothetical protein